MEESLPYLEGFAVGSVVKTLVAPLERYRLIRQTQDILTLSQKEKMGNIYQYFKNTISHNGISALWRSNLTSIYMWFPQIFAQAVFFQNIKQYTYNQDYISNCLSAVSCGLTALCFVYPFDTIRVRQATEFGALRQYTTFSETRFQIIAENGFFKGLYSGFSVGCLHTVLLSSLTVLLNFEGVPYSQELAFMSAFALLYPLDSIKHRLQVKSILFQQEAAKGLNLMEKIKFNLKEFQFQWGFGGFLTHNVRTVCTVAMASQLQNIFQNTQWNKLY